MNKRMTRLAILWACLLMCFALTGGARADTNINQRYNFDRMPLGAVAGWTNIGSPALVNTPVTDGRDGLRGFGATGGNALWTAGGTHNKIIANYSFVVHRIGTGASATGNVPFLLLNANSDNSTRYGVIAPYWNGTSWQIYILRELNGADGLAANLTCTDQSFVDGSVADVSITEDSAGLHVTCWNATALAPATAQNYTDSSPLPSGYVGVGVIAQIGGAGSAPGLVQDLHVSDYGNAAWYGTDTNATLPAGATLGNSQPIKVVTPLGYSPANTYPLVIWFHGSGAVVTGGGALPSNVYSANAAASTGELDSQPSFYGPLYAAGYIVADCNAEGMNWGNTTSQYDYVALYNYCRTNYHVSQVYFAGGSMGGLNMLLGLVNGLGLPTPAGVYMIYPVCNLLAAYADNSAFFGSYINTAYGITGSAGQDYYTLTAGHDPALYPPSAYPDIPYTIERLPGDTTVLTRNNTDVLRALLSDKRRVKAVDFRGTHGDPSTVAGDVAAAELSSFLASTGAALPPTLTKLAPSTVRVDWIADPLAISYDVVRAVGLGGLGTVYTVIARVTAPTTTYTDAAEPAGNVRYHILPVH